MQLINTGNVFSYVLTEDEWYSGTEQQREAWINEVLRKASEFRCQYAAILVDPDAVMSTSPVARRHQVWRHTFPSDNEHAFRAELQALRRATLETLTPERMAAITQEVFNT